MNEVRFVLRYDKNCSVYDCINIVYIRIRSKNILIINNEVHS